MSRFTNHASEPAKIAPKKRQIKKSVSWQKWILPAVGAIIFVLVFHSITT